MEESKIIGTEYSEIMKKSYIDYAMSVIVSRALPDVRDGLKPVQRKTLYDMYELGIGYNKPYRKSARIVGDTMGKYHPHGDSSIYDALVVMAQEFKKGMALVDGHGNFGSIEGDGAAAMRYTEARLSEITQEAYLADLDKGVVDFVSNFDETEKEPSVLPVKIPNLLVNGAEGIAVGMATNVPPHNLEEVIEGVKAYMTRDDISTRELMEYIKGPDFPTGGIVINQDELLDIYETGRGKIRLRGKVEVEEGRQGKQYIIIKEIPYTMIGAGIGRFLNDVFQLVEQKKIGDILDISNQSSKEGIRIVIELRKGADAQNLINLLYKKTRLEDTFGVNMLAVVDGRPETMGLKKIIEHHVDFQFELATRKYQTLLKKETEKREVQEGLIKACDVIDLIIEILRGSKSLQDAKNCLIYGKTEEIQFRSKYSQKMAAMLRFTERQATAILEMRLYKLIGLEVAALMEAHQNTLKNIQNYEDVLTNYESMSRVIIEELNLLKEKFGRERRTIVENGKEAIYEEKGMEEKEMMFLLDRFGYGRMIDLSTFERNQEAALQEHKFCIPCKNTGKLCVFTNLGQRHQIKAVDLPYGKFREKGTPIDNISNFDSSKEEVVYICEEEQLYFGELLFVTKKGMIKKVDGKEFLSSNRSISATKLGDEDVLLSVKPIGKQHQIVLQSRDGYFLKFAGEEVPVKKKGAIGVRGMKLKGKDEITCLYLVEEGKEEKGSYKGKMVSLNRLKQGKRDTAGVKNRGV